MSITLPSAGVPVFVRLPGNLLAWLEKADAHAAAKTFDSGVFLGTRLAPNRLGFTTLIQIACDGAKFCVARLAGIDAPSSDDTEASLDALRERIRKTIGFVQSASAAQIDASEDKDVVIPRRDGPMTLKGEAYLYHYAAPNFYFHVMAACALLRHNGVELSSADFLSTPTKRASAKGSAAGTQRTRRGQQRRRCKLRFARTAPCAAACNATTARPERRA